MGERSDDLLQSNLLSVCTAPTFVVEDGILKIEEDTDEFDDVDFKEGDDIHGLDDKTKPLSDLKGCFDSMGVKNYLQLENNMILDEVDHELDLGQYPNSKIAPSLAIGTKRHACSYCNKRFRWRYKLTHHIRSHTREKPFHCQICGKGFSVKSNLSRHMGTHTQEKPYSCLVCAKGFSVKSNLTRHMCTHSLEKPFSCEICSRGFSVKSNLSRHIRTHSLQQNEGLCPDEENKLTAITYDPCLDKGLSINTTSPDEVLLKTRVLPDVTLKSTVETESCGAPLSKVSLPSKIITSSPPVCSKNNTLSCIANSKSGTFLSVADLVSSKSTTVTRVLSSKGNTLSNVLSLKSTTLSNILCSKGNTLTCTGSSRCTTMPKVSSYGRASAFSELLPSNTSTPANTLTPSNKLLAKMFPSKTSSHTLIQEKPESNHMHHRKANIKSTSTDSQEPKRQLRPFSCQVCSKTFPTKGGLSVHMQTHTPDKRYSCEVCSKGFSTKGNLIVHMRTHTQDKPYGCDTCGKRFSGKSNLTVHVRTHTQEKPYQCSVCEKRFSGKSNLNVHVRTHTTQNRPHTCEVCGKRFLLSHTLLVHKQTHAEEVETEGDAM